MATLRDIAKEAKVSIQTVSNILNEYNPFPQPYDSNPGGHPPTPGPSREYGLRVTYAFSTK